MSESKFASPSPHVEVLLAKLKLAELLLLVKRGGNGGGLYRLATIVVCMTGSVNGNNAAMNLLQCLFLMLLSKQKSITL